MGNIDRIGGLGYPKRFVVGQDIAFCNRALCNVTYLEDKDAAKSLGLHLIQISFCFTG
jgi:hypothetical protein